MTETALAAVTSEQRVVRVFVSSTFRDLKAERDELVLRIFPQLRKLCEGRGVTWGEVDLRWGITEEQKAEGKVLPICLAEIQGCRPYFLGLLGKRYGSLPDEIDPALVEQEPWLAEHLEKSVTELEILHGVLNDPAMADHAFFYLRDPAYADGQPALQEGPTEEEIAEHGPEEAERRAEERRQKLRALKKRIRASGLPVREDYSDPQALGELVLEDLSEVIDRLFPEGSEPEPLEREAAEHEAFARSRARVYIGRPEYFEALDAHARGEGPPLVVLGESGAGKSALLANWALGYRARVPEAPAPARGSLQRLADRLRPPRPDMRRPLLLMHFIGATADSADWTAMLRRILGELERRLELRLEIPDRPDALRAAFANALHMAAAQGRVVLILDALNQLEDRDGAPDLVWLPREIPANVRLILSTLPGRALEELGKRPWPTLEVQPLEPGERERLIVDYLAQSRRALSPAHLQQIAAAEQTANPLYLQALLDELRVWGEYETLGERIDHYLAAASMDDLYEKILERYEQDYERERPGLVREAMSLLWAARRGLSEAELLDLLGSDGKPLPGAHWSPLYLAAEQSLVNRSGLIGFFHAFLGQAVRDRYLPTDERKRAAHVRLADYFERHESGSRKVTELPWQLAQAKSWRRLQDLLADLEFLRVAVALNAYEVKGYWSQVEENSPFRAAEAYRGALEAPGDRTDETYLVGALLHDMGKRKEARRAFASLRDLAHTLDPAALAAWIHYPTLLVDVGDVERALTLLRLQESEYRKWGGHGRQLLPDNLTAQAQILLENGDQNSALKLLKGAEQLYRQMGNRHGLARSLGIQADCLRDAAELEAALRLSKQAERLFRELDDGLLLAQTLGSQALILKAGAHLDRADALLKEAEELFRRLGDQAGVANSLANQALVLREEGDLDGAVKLLQEAEELFHRVELPLKVASTLGDRALILEERGDTENAISALKMQEQIYRDLDRPDLLAENLGRQVLLSTWRAA